MVVSADDDNASADAEDVNGFDVVGCDSAPEEQSKQHNLKQ